MHGTVAYLNAKSVSPLHVVSYLTTRWRRWTVEREFMGDVGVGWEKEKKEGEDSCAGRQWPVPLACWSGSSDMTACCARASFTVTAASVLVYVSRKLSQSPRFHAKVTRKRQNNNYHTKYRAGQTFFCRVNQRQVNRRVEWPIERRVCIHKKWSDENNPPTNAHNIKTRAYLPQMAIHHQPHQTLLACFFLSLNYFAD